MYMSLVQNGSTLKHSDRYNRFYTDMGKTVDFLWAEEGICKVIEMTMIYFIFLRISQEFTISPQKTFET